MKTLYIHIGSPKTGTSAIQQFLQLNAGILYEKGYIFRSMPFPEHFQREYNSVSRNRNGFFLHETDSELYQIGLDTLLKWFKEKDKIILSDEGLYSRAGKRGAEEKLKSFADKNGIKVCFVLYLRRQDEFLESFYRQAMKSNMIHTLPISSYVEKRLKNDDYSAKIAFFSDFFGKDSICVRRYDRESWKVQGTNIFADFLSCIGLSLSDEYKLPGKDVNTSLSSNVAEIKRIVNQVNPYLDPEKQLKVNRLFNTAGERCSILSPDKEKYSILSKEDRRGILDAVRESNDNVARDYLDLDHLFSEDIADAPVWNKNNPDFLDDVILYYALVTARLQERLVKQQEDLRKIKRFIPFFWPQLFREWRERRKNTKGKE